MGEGFGCDLNSLIKERETVLTFRGFLGYVQGMSDLCAPIYVVMGGDEAMTYWCFVEVMSRMVCLFFSTWGEISGADRRNWRRNPTSIEIRAG